MGVEVGDIVGSAAALACPACGGKLTWKPSTDYHHPLIQVCKGDRPPEGWEWGFIWCCNCGDPVDRDRLETTEGI